LDNILVIRNAHFVTFFSQKSRQHKDHDNHTPRPDDRGYQYFSPTASVILKHNSRYICRKIPDCPCRLRKRSDVWSLII